MAIPVCDSRILHERREKAFRVMLMADFCKRLYIIWMVFSLSLSSFAQGSNHYDLRALNVFIHRLANDILVQPHTGILYNIPLPANFSGMEVSVIRLRRGQFWAKGANISFFHIPSRIRPMPYVERLAILFQNFGNWSSYYYNVPGYRLVAPVFGFLAYDSMHSGMIGIHKLKFYGLKDPIAFQFSHHVLEGKNVTPKCVIFSADGLVKKKKIRKMEKQSEKGVAIDTFWIGGTKMPSASMIRTQPALENEYVP
nr:hypothetical protein CFP56_49829 [Quercus suber]